MTLNITYNYHVLLIINNMPKNKRDTIKKKKDNKLSNLLRKFTRKIYYIKILKHNIMF